MNKLQHSLAHLKESLGQKRRLTAPPCDTAILVDTANTSRHYQHARELSRLVARPKQSDYCAKHYQLAKQLSESVARPVLSGSPGCTA